LSEVTKYETGTPCWVDVQSPDIAAASVFYEGLFGWTAEDQGEEAGHYTIFKLNGLDVAALGPLQAEGMPSMWTTHIATDDVDATATAVEAAGGAVFAPPFDVFDSGRMAVFADAAGAVFAGWQAKDHIGAQLVNEPNTLIWNELTVRDMDAALEFYGKVFGYTANEIDMGEPGAPPYRELQLNGRTIGGAMQITDDWPTDVPSHWKPYFAVEDTDETAAKAAGLGGTVDVPPSDMPPGRFAVLSDPGGAPFTILKPSPMT
jgi:predicted enzyme related to lactoylglutathione lyase